MEQERTDQQQRESFLFVFYLLSVCGLIFLLLFAACGAMIVYMALVGVGIGVFALMHWWLWGHSLTRTLTAEPPPDEPAAEPAPPPPEDDPYRGRY